MKLTPKFSKSPHLVYSTDQGEMCPGCGKSIKQCVCKKGYIPTGDGIVRITRDTSGRKGKCVTVITGVLLEAEKLKQMCTQFKKLCGTGGTVKADTIEIQGDHRTTLLAKLTQMGYTTKLSGANHGKSL